MSEQDEQRQKQDDEAREQQLLDALEWFWMTCERPWKEAEPKLLLLCRACGVNPKLLIATSKD